MNAKIARIVRIVLLVGACIALFFGIYSSKNAGNYRAHDPEKIVIEITDLDKKYNEQESPYTNGCYHVFVEYKITNNTSAAINYIQFDSTIKNDNEEALAQISSDYGDISAILVKAGESKSFKADLSDNQPVENNNIQFMNLYEAEASDIHADCNITSVIWEDGVQYTNNNPTESVNIIDATDGNAFDSSEEETVNNDTFSGDYSSEYILPNSSSEYITEYDAQALSYDELQYAINEIYARHGRIFTDPDVKAYFNSLSWYSGTKKDVSMNELNEFEQENIKTLTNERKSRDSLAEDDDF